ncbi:MAG: cytochrome c, partial [Planctomycetota bacterium]
MTVLPRAVLRAALLVAAALVAGSPADALRRAPGDYSPGPLLPGLHGKHGLDQAAQGRVLLRELRCAACHAGLGQETALPAPDLSGVAHRVRTDYLRRFLMSPHATDPGTTMPDVLGTLSEAERAETVGNLVQFLLSLKLGQGASPVTHEGTSHAKLAERGASLFHRVGCVVCHGPRRSVYVDEPDPAPEPGQLRLESIASKYAPGELAAFLYEPHSARPAGRMPDMGLSRDEAGALEAYLLDGSTAPQALLPVDPVAVGRGRTAFI